MFAREWQQGHPHQNTRVQSGIVYGCVNEKHEGPMVSDMQRGVREKAPAGLHFHMLSSLVTALIIKDVKPI